MDETFDETLRQATSSFVEGECATAGPLFLKCFLWPMAAPKPSRAVRRSFPLVFLALLSKSDEGVRQELVECFEEMESGILRLQFDFEDVLDAGSLSVVLGREARLEHVLEIVQKDGRVSETLVRRITCLRQHARGSLFPSALRSVTAEGCTRGNEV